MTEPEMTEPEIKTVFDPSSGMETVSMDSWPDMGLVPTAEMVAKAEALEGKTYDGPVAAAAPTLEEIVAQMAATQEAVDYLLLADLEDMGLGGLLDL